MSARGVVHARRQALLGQPGEQRLAGGAVLWQIVGIDFDDHLGDLAFTEQRHQCFDDLVFMAFHVDLDGDAAAGGDVEDEIGNLLAAQHHDGAAAAFADVGDAAVTRPGRDRTPHALWRWTRRRRR